MTQRTHGLRSRTWKKFCIGTSMSVSGNVACRLCSANEGNTCFWRYFSRHWEGNLYLYFIMLSITAVIFREKWSSDTELLPRTFQRHCFGTVFGTRTFHFRHCHGVGRYDTGAVCSGGDSVTQWNVTVLMQCAWYIVYYNCSDSCGWEWNGERILCLFVCLFVS